MQSGLGVSLNATRQNFIQRSNSSRHAILSINTLGQRGESMVVRCAKHVILLVLGQMISPIVLTSGGQYYSSTEVQIVVCRILRSLQAI